MGARRLIVPGVDSANFGLKLARVTGGYLIESSLGRYSVVCGKENKYLITDSRVYALSEECFSAVMPLVRAVEARGRLFVAENDMSRFYNSVLARVMTFTEIDAGEVNLSMFEAAPLELKVYLDSFEGGVRANVHASYDGETDIDILDDDISSPFVRDYESEQAFLRILQKYFPDYPSLEVRD